MSHVNIGLLIYFHSSSIEASIEFIFEKLEKKFGPVLIQHAFSYITASKVSQIFNNISVVKYFYCQVRDI